jgi:5'-3' exonuclease
MEAAMSALFERPKNGSNDYICAGHCGRAGYGTWFNLSCTIKQASFTAGQKNDIDVTVLCSDETENINGLPAPSEMSLSGNFYRNPADASCSIR